MSTLSPCSRACRAVGPRWKRGYIRRLWRETGQLGVDSHQTRPGPGPSTIVFLPPFPPARFAPEPRHFVSQFAHLALRKLLEKCVCAKTRMQSWGSVTGLDRVICAKRFLYDWKFRLRRSPDNPAFNQLFRLPAKELFCLFDFGAKAATEQKGDLFCPAQVSIQSVPRC